MAPWKNQADAREKLASTIETTVTRLNHAAEEAGTSFVLISAVAVFALALAASALIVAIRAAHDR